MKTRSAFGMALLSALVPAVTGLSTALAESLPLSAAPVGAGGPTSMVASSRSSRLDAALFVAAYDEPGWGGSVTGYRIRAKTALLEAAGLWGDVPARAASADGPAEPARPQSTATLMDARDDRWPATRLVLSASSATATRVNLPGLSNFISTKVQLVPIFTVLLNSRHLTSSRSRYSRYSAVVTVLGRIISTSRRR